MLSKPGNLFPAARCGAATAACTRRRSLMAPKRLETQTDAPRCILLMQAAPPPVRSSPLCLTGGCGRRPLALHSPASIS